MEQVSLIGDLRDGQRVTFADLSAVDERVSTVG
jgi:hypothetical protein